MTDSEGPENDSSKSDSSFHGESAKDKVSWLTLVFVLSLGVIARLRVTQLLHLFQVRGKMSDVKKLQKLKEDSKASFRGGSTQHFEDDGQPVSKSSVMEDNVLTLICVLKSGYCRQKYCL